MTNLERPGNAAMIVDLHQRIVNNARKSLDLAIQLRGLLTEQRNKVQHGEWENWVKAHLPFTPRTASNYMRLHRIRDQIKSESVSDLADAYKLLAGPAPMNQYEAETVSAQIRESLHRLAETVIPFTEELRRIRDREAFAPDYPSFEAYLLDLGITQDQFRALGELYDALRAWTSGSSAEAVLNIILATAA